jgi:hypothetical protein
MKTTSKRGGNLTRTETVTVRFDPRLRYLLEIASRQHRRTVSSYIEFVLSKAIDEEPVKVRHADEWTTIGVEATYLWDIDVHERLRVLAARFPHLLNFDEQVKLRAGDGPR